jgi:TonB family protein
MIRFDPVGPFAVRAFATALAACAIMAVSAPVSARDPVPATLADWRAAVNRQIDAKLDLPAGGLRHGDHAVATVLVSLDADGRLADVALAEPTGEEAVDAEALRTARAVHYPPLPAGLRGRPRTIAMLLYFGEPGSETAALRQVAEAAALAAAAERKSDRSATAAACAAKPPIG